MVSSILNSSMRIIVAVLLIGIAPATAQDASIEAIPLQPYNNTGLYEISWKGLPVGKLVLSASEAHGTYKMDLVSRTVGAVWLATRHKSTMATQGIFAKEQYIPRHYETDFKLRDDNRLITLDFDVKDGRLTGETNSPEEPEWKRPKVPTEPKRYALDPLTPFFQMRPLVYSALKQPDKARFTLRYYDARRLTDLHFNVVGREIATLGQSQIPVVRVEVTRTAIAGYKEKELKEIAEHDIRLELLLSDDGRLLPLRIAADTSFGTVYFHYRQACPSLEACRKLVK